MIAKSSRWALDDKTVPVRVAIHAKKARFAFSRYDDEEQLDETRPIPHNIDGYLYYFWPGRCAEHLTIEDAKAAADGQSWGPVEWD
jgi:hypothetical protein